MSRPCPVPSRKPLWLLSLAALGLSLSPQLSSGVWAEPPAPATIAEAVEMVKKAKAGNASDQSIARLVMEIVDRRITNGNDWDLPESEYDRAIKTEAGKAAIKRANTEREDFGVGLGKHYGMEYALRSEWAWSLGYGNCNETSSTAFRILKDAGFTNIRMLETTAKGGHAFVVFGMDDGADPGDPSTWGKSAYVVDPWRRNVLTSDEAARDEWIADGGKHKPGNVTDKYDDPKMYEVFRKRFVKQPYKSKLEEALAIKKGMDELGQSFGEPGAMRKALRDFTREEVGDAVTKLGLEPNMIEGNGIVRLTAFKPLPGGMKPGDAQTIVRVTLYRNKATMQGYHKDKLGKAGNSTLTPTDWGNVNADGMTLPGRQGDFPDQEFFPIGSAELGLLYQNLYIQVISQKAGGAVGKGQDNYKKAQEAGRDLNDSARGPAVEFGKKLLHTLGNGSAARN